MGNKERILKLLSQEPLTSYDIAQKLNLNESDTRVYLLRLSKAKRIQVIDKMGRYKVYSMAKSIDSKNLVKIEELKYLLNRLYGLMSYKFEKKTNLILSKEDLNMLERVKKVIQQDDLLSKVKKIKIRFKERRELKEFIEFGKECPICHKVNDEAYLEEIYFGKELKMIELRKSIQGKLLNKEKAENINFGIPCCNCYSKFSERKKDENLE